MINYKEDFSIWFQLQFISFSIENRLTTKPKLMLTKLQNEDGIGPNEVEMLNFWLLYYLTKSVLNI